MTEPTTRHGDDGFRGDYPTSDPGIETFYRDHGMQAPWLLEWEDGRPVLDENGQPKLAVRPTRPPVGRSQRYYRG